MPLQRLQRSPSSSPRAAAAEAGDVDLDARLGEREEVRADADVAVGAEDRPGERQQRPVEVGEGDPLADRQALDLVEHRRVGGVGVAAVDAPGNDDEDRRLLRLHPADLHRRGVGAQEHVARAGRHRQRRAVGADELGVGAERARVDVEGVLEQPRRMPGRVVERGEVVVVVLDLGPLERPGSRGRRRRPRSRAGCGSAGAGGRAARGGVPGSVTSIDSPARRRVELGRARAARAPPSSSASSSTAGLVAGLADRARARRGSSSPIPRRIVVSSALRPR